MNNDDFDATQAIVQRGFRGLLVKLHLDEIAEAVLDVVTRFHREIGKGVEAVCKQIPIVMMLAEALGNVAAIAKLRKPPESYFEKKALGIKVSSGLITFGIAIAAFAVPHLSVPLIIAGTASNLAYSYFSIYKVRARQRHLEKELHQLPATQGEQYAEINEKIDQLKDDIAEHKEKILKKTITSVLSTIVLIGMIVILANPFTAAPVSIIMAIATVAYTAYHYHKPIIARIKRLGNAIRRMFGNSDRSDDVSEDQSENRNQEQQQHTDVDVQKATQAPTAAPKPKPAVADFLSHQAAALAKAAPHDTFQHAHEAAPTKPDINDFLQHETKTLETIAMHTIDAPTPKPTPTITVTDTDDETAAVSSIAVTDEEDDDGGGSGGCSNKQDASCDLDEAMEAAERESQPEPELRM